MAVQSKRIINHRSSYLGVHTQSSVLSVVCTALWAQTLWVKDPVNVGHTSDVRQRFISHTDQIGQAQDPSSFVHHCAPNSNLELSVLFPTILKKRMNITSFPSQPSFNCVLEQFHYCREHI